MAHCRPRIGDHVYSIAGCFDVPNMFKIAGELTAGGESCGGETVRTHALSFLVTQRRDGHAPHGFCFAGVDSVQEQVICLYLRRPLAGVRPFLSYTFSTDSGPHMK